MADENKDDPIDIELEDEKLVAADDIVIDEPKPEAKDKAGSVDDEIETLKASVERERQGRIAAEQHAAQATHVAVQKSNEVADTNLSLVTNAISTLNMAQEGLEANHAAALEAGDYAAASSIQREMSRNEAKLQRLEEGKGALEAAPKIEAPAQQQGDPVEALASQLSPKSAAWVRQHPEYAREPRLYQKMLAAHNLAMADGLSVDSDDYFGAIEDTLKINSRAPERHDDSALSDASAPVQRRSAPPAAPVSRSGTGDGSRPNRVTLSPEEREAAENSGLTYQEYAKHKLALIEEGVLTKH